MFLRVCYWKILLCSSRSILFLACAITFLLITSSVITIHVTRYNVGREPRFVADISSNPSLPLSTITNLPAPINTSNHHSIGTARKTLNLTGRQRTVTLLGDMFNPERYISSQRNPPNASDPMKHHHFNQLASDTVAFDRRIFDVRNTRCKRFDPIIDVSTSVSIIICFHNEARSALLRTVYSVLDKTPSTILKEILLIDDFSDDVKDGDLLELIPKVKVIRLSSRQGLIRARLIGTDHAEGRVLVFLDSHCEVTTGWIQPLLNRIKTCKRCIVSPLIDIIDKKNMRYVSTQTNIKGGFDYNLYFKWVKLNAFDMERRRKDVTGPIPSPAIAGGLFAVDKEFFKKLGLYDEEMDIWGGENVELSMRTWMCGGRLEIIPCSRVGHIFRSSMPYTFGVGKTYLTTVIKNLCRTAEVWMDDDKSLFYSSIPEAKLVDFGNITARTKLREKLQCKSFEWYIDTIYPEFRKNYTQAKYVQLLQMGNGCVAMATKGDTSFLRLERCELIATGPSSKQIWELTSDGQIKHNNVCLAVEQPRPQSHPHPINVTLQPCMGVRNEHSQSQYYQQHLQQMFVIRSGTDDDDNMIIHSETNLCLATTPGRSVHLTNCNSDSSHRSSDYKWSLRKLP